MGAQIATTGGNLVPFQFRRGRLVFLACLAAIAIFFAFTSPTEVAYPTWLPNASPAPVDAPINELGSCSPAIPRTIWQAWGLFSNDATPPNEDVEKKSRTWPDRNPHYEYIRLNMSSARAYAEEKFAHRPDILRIYDAANESVLQADLIRYLVLLADGGIYTDMDTECRRSIDLWARGYEHKDIGLIIGVEYDQMGHKTLLDGYSRQVQIAQWTIASRPNHPVLAYANDMIIKGLEKRLEEKGNLSATSQGDVLDITGPRIFSEGIRLGLGEYLDRDITYSDFSLLKEPKVFGDVLLLNINGFATGIPGETSGVAGEDNPQQLLRHHFHGKWRNGLP